MKHFGAFEAKTHFSELLRYVIKGEKFIITKHGIEVAMIIPFIQEEGRDGEGVDSVKDAIRALKTLRKGITLGKKLSIKKLLEEGRR